MILIGLSVLQLLNSSQAFHLLSSQTSVCKKMGLEMGSMDRFSKKFYLEKNLNILIVLILNLTIFWQLNKFLSGNVLTNVMIWLLTQAGPCDWLPLVNNRFWGGGGWTCALNMLEEMCAERSKVWVFRVIRRDYFVIPCNTLGTLTIVTEDLK